MTSAQAARFVVCIRNTGYPAALELHKVYEVTPDQQASADGDIRIVDESGEDYLYPSEWFLPAPLFRSVGGKPSSCYGPLSN